jgi:hypothetical protein
MFSPPFKAGGGMGWFVIAALLGFFVYRAHNPLDDARKRAAKKLDGWLNAAATTLSKILHGQVTKRAAVGALILVVVVLVLSWASARGDTFTWFANAIGSGHFARVVLGFILGFAWGYATEYGKQVGVPFVAALGIVALTALASPHIDRWFQQLTSLKTSLIEIQLTSISATSAPLHSDQRESFVEIDALRFANDIGNSVERDIAYLKWFAIPDAEARHAVNPRTAVQVNSELEKYRTHLKQLEEIEPVFTEIIQPLAVCIKTAIDRGWSIATAQAELRPSANLLKQIIATENRPDSAFTAGVSKAGRLVDLRYSLWSELWTAANHAKEFIGPGQDDDCGIKRLGPFKNYPPLANYRNLPQTHSAMALLLMFVRDDEFALEILQKSESGWDFDDLVSPFIRSWLMFYRRDSVDRYFSLLEKMRNSAQQQMAVIKRVVEDCGERCSVDMKRWQPLLDRRGRTAKLKALNVMAYAVAVDVADGVPEAAPMFAIAEEYAEMLRSELDGNKDIVSDPDPYFDTIAFVTIVSEARKPVRDQERIRKTVDILEKIEARQRQNIAREVFLKRLDYTIIRTVRAHLASARALLN